MTGTLQEQGGSIKNDGTLKVCTFASAENSQSSPRSDLNSGGGGFTRAKKGKIERKQAAEDYKQLRIVARLSELWDGSGASDVMCLNKNSSQENDRGRPT